METNIEFEEMKLQLRLLQQRLDKQIEINNRQTRRAIDEGMGSISSKDRRALIVCILGALIVPIVLIKQCLPNYFVISTFVFLLANVVWQYLLCFDKSRLAEKNLVEAAKYLTRYKRNSNLSILVGFILGLSWSICYGVLSGKLHLLGEEDITMLITSITIGTAIGVIIGLKLFYLPKMRTINNLLRQIEEVQGEK